MRGFWRSQNRFFLRNSHNMETVNLTQIQSQPRSKWQEFRDNFSFVQYVLGVITAAIIGICATYTTIQITATAQTKDIQRHGEKIEKLEKDSVSKDLFDERTKTILDRLDKQDSKLDKLLEKK